METVRADVVTFCLAMEKVLDENEHKGGWEGANIPYLMEQLRGEFEELECLYSDGCSKNLCATPIDEVIEQYRKHQKEVVDIANFCMMQYCNLERRIAKLRMRRDLGYVYPD